MGGRWGRAGAGLAGCEGGAAAPPTRPCTPASALLPGPLPPLLDALQGRPLLGSRLFTIQFLFFATFFNQSSPCRWHPNLRSSRTTRAARQHFGVLLRRHPRCLSPLPAQFKDDPGGLRLKHDRKGLLSMVGAGPRAALAMQPGART